MSCVRLAYSSSSARGTAFPSGGKAASGSQRLSKAFRLSRSSSELQRQLLKGSGIKTDNLSVPFEIGRAHV